MMAGRVGAGTVEVDSIKEWILNEFDSIEQWKGCVIKSATKLATNFGMHLGKSE